MSTGLARSNGNLIAQPGVILVSVAGACSRWDGVLGVTRPPTFGQ